MFRLLVGVLAAAIGASAASAQPPIPAHIAQAVADSTRPEAQRARDEKRKPAEVLAFAGLKVGDKVGEIFPGGGYFTHILCRAVGPSGAVFTASFPPARPPGGAGRGAGPPAGGAPPGGARAGGAPGGAPPGAPSPGGTAPPGGPGGAPGAGAASAPACPNVTPSSMPADQFRFPPGLDFVFTSENLHDLHTAVSGKPDMTKFNKAVFDALVPGGTYLVIDYRAQAGSGTRDTETLHRIDPELIKKEVLSAGFKFIAESDLLHNPADPLTVDARENPRTGSLRTNEAENLHGKTDHFIFTFRKP